MFHPNHAKLPTSKHAQHRPNDLLPLQFPRKFNARHKTIKRFPFRLGPIPLPICNEYQYRFPYNL